MHRRLVPLLVSTQAQALAGRAPSQAAQTSWKHKSNPHSVNRDTQPLSQISRCAGPHLNSKEHFPPPNHLFKWKQASTARKSAFKWH